MQEALHLIGKQHGSIVDDFFICCTYSLPNFSFVSLTAISIGALCFTDHSEKLFFCGKQCRKVFHVKNRESQNT